METGDVVKGEGVLDFTFGHIFRVVGSPNRVNNGDIVMTACNTEHPLFCLRPLNWQEGDSHWWGNHLSLYTFEYLGHIRKIPYNEL